MSDDPPIARIPPPGFLAGGAAAAALAALPGARAVGGAVRDALAGRPIQDVDIAVPLPPEKAAARLRAAGLKVFEIGLAHGTVTAVLDHQPVEVTSLRRDVVTDGRHAEVAWTADWREDAARRDFTINAMSLSAEGALWDYFGGRADLAGGVVRFVGEPGMRLAEDYLRALRFFRFQARYGRGTPDAAAIAAIRAAVPGLARLSVERVWMELKRLLAAPDPTGALALMAETGVLAAVLPEATRPDRLNALVALSAPPEPMLRLAGLVDFPRDRLMDSMTRLWRRLRWSGQEQQMLRAAIGAAYAAPISPALSQTELRRALAILHEAFPDVRPAAAWRGWLAAADAFIAEGPTFDSQLWAAHIKRLTKSPAPVFPLRGQDALDLGMAPGARVGALMAGLREWWLAGGCEADRSACLAELARRLGGG